jgi:hypothetical protein
MHNEKLTEENDRLKMIIEDLQLEKNVASSSQFYNQMQTSNTARFAAEESEILINKLRREL